MHEIGITTIEVTDCCVCGVMFGVPKNMLNKLRESGGDFYCPNGHALRYSDPEVKRLRRQLVAARGNAAYYEELAEAERRSKAAVKGHLTRTQKRVKAGMCPCCNRHFANVEKHMATKHPDYPEASADRD